MIFLDQAVDAAAACRAASVKTVAVTAGSIFAELALVLETLEYLKHEADVWFELTTLLIPGETTRPQNSTT